MTPLIAGAGVLLDDDGRNVQAPQPGSQRNAALTATDDQAIGISLYTSPLSTDAAGDEVS
nr:hypothetical protein [Verminephrobacter aporrectodeae]